MADKANKGDWRIYLLVFGGILVTWIVVGSLPIYLVSVWRKDLPLDRSGTLGDTFGAVNALFSGMAFAGVIYSVILQRQELHETKEELRRSSKSQEETARTLRAHADFLQVSARATTIAALTGARVAKTEANARRQKGNLEETVAQLDEIVCMLEASLVALNEIAAASDAGRHS